MNVPFVGCLVALHCAVGTLILFVGRYGQVARWNMLLVPLQAPIKWCTNPILSRRRKVQLVDSSMQYFIYLFIEQRKKNSWMGALYIQNDCAEIKLLRLALWVQWHCQCLYKSVDWRRFSRRMMSTTIEVAFFMVGVSVAVVKWVNNGLLLLAPKESLRNMFSMNKEAVQRDNQCKNKLYQKCLGCTWIGIVIRALVFGNEIL